MGTLLLPAFFETNFCCSMSIVYFCLGWSRDNPWQPNPKPLEVEVDMFPRLSFRLRREKIAPHHRTFDKGAPKARFSINKRKDHIHLTGFLKDNNNVSYQKLWRSSWFQSLRYWRAPRGLGWVAWQYFCQSKLQTPCETRRRALFCCVWLLFCWVPPK